MDFEQLRIFLVLAEERTFLGAANRLATSRSRVRRKLDQLEADAGTVPRQSNFLMAFEMGLLAAGDFRVGVLESELKRQAPRFGQNV